MAVAEARAAWQRTANRCFVQEDAKRAPKLACCPSTSNSSSKQSDAVPVNTTEGQDNPNPGFVPPKRNLSHSNLSTDLKWWLQMQQTNYRNPKCFTNEQLDTTPDIEMENSRMYSGSHIDNDNKMQESVKVVDEVCFDLGEKSAPWWRKADRDDLAWLVAQKSLEHNIENCDLPQPQNTRAKVDPFAHIGSFDGSGIGVFSPGNKDNYYNKTHSVCLRNPIVHKPKNVSSVTECGKKWASVEGDSQFARDKPMSDYRTHKLTNEMRICGNDPSKAQLLEALRHSQTRAREAEKVAQQAYAEKEHILKLFFRQASHLFAYKQWLQLLQLENFYFELKNSMDQPASGLPFFPHKTQKFKNSKTPVKRKRAKQAPSRCSIIGKCTFFALVGAGLLLGWTIGWALI